MSAWSGRSRHFERGPRERLDDRSIHEGFSIGDIETPARHAEHVGNANENTQESLTPARHYALPRFRSCPEACPEACPEPVP